MPATNPWDETQPLGSALASTIDDIIRTLKLDIRERINLQHVWNVSQADDGNHRNIVIPTAYNAADTETLIASGGSITGALSKSFLEISGTWNTSGTPTGIKLNVTDTGSNAASLLCDLQIGGSSKFKIQKDGLATLISLLCGASSFTGAMQLADNILQRPELKDYAETVETVAAAANVTFDFETGNHKYVSLTTNITGITLSHPPAAGRAGMMIITFEQDGVGGRTVAGWPASVFWPNGAPAPTITATASKTDMITLYTRDGGTKYRAFVSGQAWS